MKQIVRDQELMAYLEGTLSGSEISELRTRLADQGEADLLYHLELAQERKIEEEANALFGSDTFHIEQEEVLFQPPYAVAAKFSPNILDDGDRNDKQ